MIIFWVDGGEDFRSHHVEHGDICVIYLVLGFKMAMIIKAHYYLCSTIGSRGEMNFDIFSQFSCFFFYTSIVL